MLNGALFAFETVRVRATLNPEMGTWTGPWKETSVDPAGNMVLEAGGDDRGATDEIEALDTP